VSFNFGASGLSSAQAQKLTANPSVASPSITPAWRVLGAGVVGAGRVGCIAVIIASQCL